MATLADFSLPARLRDVFAQVARVVVTDEVRSLLAAGRARAEAIAIAVRHLRVPLLASTLTTVLGFMPVFWAFGVALLVACGVTLCTRNRSPEFTEAAFG